MHEATFKPSISFEIVDDGAAARLIVPGTVDPDDLDVSGLVRQAQSQGLLVDAPVRAKLEEVARSFREQPRDLDLCLAEASPPIDGEDGRLEWMAGCDPTRGLLRPDAADSPERVDHYNRTSYVRVTKGAHLATIHPPTAGHDGRDVTGRVLPATPGRTVQVTLGDGLAAGEKGRLIAHRDGLLKFKNASIRVSRLFEVGGCVDFSTGNIDFDGTVTVKEGVCDCFRIQATEDIIICGLVEAAHIECGRDLECSQGMAAKGRGHLRIGKDADVRYLNSVTGVVTGSLSVQREVVNCRLVVGGLMGQDATVMGGEISVSGPARIGRVGSERGTPTTLVIGTTAMQGLQLQRLEQMARAVEHQLGERRMRHDALVERRRSVGVEERLAALRLDLSELEDDLASLRREAEEIRRTADGPEETAPADLVVTKIIHPDVRLLMGDCVLSIDRPLKGPLTFLLSGDGEPWFRLGSGPACPASEVATLLGRAA